MKAILNRISEFLMSRILLTIVVILMLFSKVDGYTYVAIIILTYVVSSLKWK